MHERANIASNSGFIEIEKVEFEYILHIEFQENELFEFKLKFRDKFAEFWVEYFEYF